MQKEKNQSVSSGRGFHLSSFRRVFHLSSSRRVGMRDTSGLLSDCHCQVCGPQGLGISTLFPRPLRERVAVGRVRGFTLLEILVTVVIIAILATIAVSAYQKAVVKSRFGSLMPLAKALTSSNEEFYLRNGRYATNVGDLDVTSGGTTKAQITMGNESQHKFILLTRDDMNNQLRIYQKHSPNFPGEIHCEALIDDEIANWLCRDSLKGTPVGSKYGYAVYTLSENSTGILDRIYYDIIGGKLSDGDKCIVAHFSGSFSTRFCANLEINHALCDAQDAIGCAWSTFDNQSTCNGKGQESCGSNKFTNQSSCLAVGYISCRDNTYTKSTCTSDYPGGTNCGGGTYKDHSVCYANASNSCGRSYHRGSSWFTNYSYCVGNASNSCKETSYTDHSYCQANATNSCPASTSSYDATSYCEGTYCPVGTPKQGGGTWQLCEGESEGGKTC